MIDPPTSCVTLGTSPWTSQAVMMPMIGISRVKGTTALVGYLDSRKFQMPYPISEAPTAV